VPSGKAWLLCMRIVRWLVLLNTILTVSIVLPSANAQAVPCAAITRNPLVLEALLDSHTSDAEAGVENDTINAAGLAHLQFSPIVIQPGDALYVEYRGRDFTINANFASGEMTAFDSSPRGSYEQWRRGILPLDMFRAALQRKLMRLRATAKNPDQVLFRNIKIIRAGRPVFEFAKLASYGKPQAKAAVQRQLPCVGFDETPAVGTPVAVNYSIPNLGAPPNFADGLLFQPLSPLFPLMMQSTDTTPGANHYKFTGKELDDETGLYNFGARYYSPALSRFMSRDPKVISTQRMLDPQQWNMYSYSRNNPTSYFDPDGKEVRALDAGALTRIRQTLPANVRSSVVADKNGFISGKALSGVQSNDANFQALKGMVGAKGIVEVSTGPSATNKAGKTDAFKYETGKTPALKADYAKAGITPDPNKVYANFTGETYSANESKSGNIEVHVSDGTGQAAEAPGVELTVTMGHEMYVHGQNLLKGQPAEHENTLGPVNKQTHEVEERTRKNAQEKDLQ